LSYATLSLMTLPLVTLPLAGCAGTKTLTDPILRLQTEGGSELGVTTDHGVVFLGRSATRGSVEIEAKFGDGLNLERSVVEPIGGGIYTARTEIKLPSVAVSFAESRAGDTLIVAGRTERGSWERRARVVEDERIFGLLLASFGGELERPDQVGAGVFREVADGRRELVGLVSGRVTLGRDTYLAVVGPDVTWRLLAYRRDLLRHTPRVYRDDVY